MDVGDAKRLSSLFGAELGGRLAKLCLDVDPPTVSPTRVNAVEQSEAATACEDDEHTLHSGPESPGDEVPHVNAGEPTFERSSSLPTKVADGGGVGIFDKIRRASSSHYQDPVNPRPPSAQGPRPQQGGFGNPRPKRDSRPSTANSDSRSSERHSEPARPPSSGGDGSAVASRRAEMAARAQAALRRQQRREQGANGSSNPPSTAATGAQVPGSSGRELFTINIEYNGARKLLSSVILTRTEFNTFTFLDLRQRAAQEQHWGAGDIMASIQDSTGRARQVRDFEVLMSRVQHNATVTFEPVNKTPQQRPSSGQAHSGMRGSVPPGGVPNYPQGPSPAHSRKVPLSQRPQSGAQQAGQRQPAGGYAARAASQGGRSNYNQAAGNNSSAKASGTRKDMELAALWHGWLTAELPNSLGKLSDRQLQVFMVQSGVPPSEVQRLGRSQLVDAAERLVPQWEVARILACSGAQQVLRTTPSSTGAEVKAAYRRLMVKVHPDKNSSNEAGRAMSILTESFQQLTPK